MLIHKPQYEKRKYLAVQAKTTDSYRIQSPMTRQALYRLLQSLPQKVIVAPKFIPAGAYHPLVLTEKSIVYYDVPLDLHIDWDAVRRRCPDPSTCVIYYIHQFGLHINANVRALRQLQAEGYRVIDDRSLTLPTDNYAEFGDATPYSFYKLVGIPYGAEIRIANDFLKGLDEKTATHDTLLKTMASNYYFYSNPLNRVMPALVFRSLNKLIAPRVGFNHLIGDVDYYEHQALPPKSKIVLSSIDYHGITKRRIEIAERYLRALNRRFLLPVEQESYSVQSCMGFPIMVDKPGAYVKYLIRRGVYSFRFTDIWWWLPNEAPCELYNRNVLLPAHHHLSDREVDYIIRLVNECPIP